MFIKNSLTIKFLILTSLSASVAEGVSLKKYSQTNSCTTDQIKHLRMLAKSTENPTMAIKTFCDSLTNKPAAKKSSQRKVGVIVPSNSPVSNAGKALKEGITKAINNTQISNVIFVNQNSNNLIELDENIAKLILNENVGIIIGGISTKAASRIKYWSQNIGFPSILLSGKINISSSDKQVFKMSPDPEDLANALAKESRSRGYKSIATLTPNNTKEYNLTRLITESFENDNIKVVKNAYYEPTSYQSMELAARSIMQLRPDDRPQELSELMRKKRLEASTSNLEFNPRMIALPPKIDFDAVFISDHFRNVRYFVKIFKYLGASKTPLFGNHQWRSKTLLKPFDRFLNHSFFYDFIGRYDQLPPGLGISYPETPYFTPPTTSQSLDYQIMGYRSAEIASRALRSYYSKAQLWRALELVQDKNSKFFPHGYVFKKNHYAYWPKHIISLIDGRPNLYRVK